MKSGRGFLANNPTTILLGSKVSPVAAALMNVTPENVLKVRAALLREVESLSRYLTDQFIRGDRIIGLCGGDPISKDAQGLFTYRVRAVAVVPVQQYALKLRDAADQLSDVAKSYGFTERQITDSFRSNSVGLA